MGYEGVAIALAALIFCIIVIYCIFVTVRWLLSRNNRAAALPSSSSSTVSRNEPVARVFIDLPNGDRIEVVATVSGRRFSIIVGDGEPPCVICMLDNREANALLRPCRHAVCVACADRIGDRCPFCRVQLECR